MEIKVTDLKYVDDVVLIAGSRTDLESCIEMLRTMTERQDRNQMFWPNFARGPWPETTKSRFQRTNQTANK